MNHNFFKTTFKYSLFLSSLFLLSTNYAADINGGIINGGGTTSPSMNLKSSPEIVGGYSHKYWSAPKSGQVKAPNLYMITQSPSYPDTLVVKYFYNQYDTAITAPTVSAKNPETSGYLSTGSMITNLLTASTQSSFLSLTKAMAQFLPLDNSGQVFSFADNKAVRGSGGQSEIGVLNANSLIGPLQYAPKTDEQSNAESFINYITNQYYPKPRLDFSTFIKEAIVGSDNLNSALRSPSVQRYLYAVRQIAAVNSVGISNLNYLYNERVPQKTSTLLKNIPSLDIANQTLPANLQKTASPLAMEQWIATRRLSSPNTGTGGVTPWVQSIESASPATLQRETVYLLAEIQQQLFKQRMLAERLLVTTSVQQLQGSNVFQLQLEQLQRSICSSAPFKGTGACPPAPAPSAISSSSNPPPPQTAQQQEKQ